MDPWRRPSARAWMVAALIVALLVVAFRPLLVWMVDRWSTGDSYYSHGFFVPLVAMAFIWRDRRVLRAAYARDHAGSWLGLAVFLLGLLGLLVSGILSIYFTAAFTLIVTLWGLGGFLFGRPVMRRLGFPAFVLTFMAPLPLEMIAGVSLRLKLLAGDLAIRSMNAIGLMATNDGSTIYLGNDQASTVVVGDACSGLRSLISLLFLGVLFAYLSGLTPPRKGVVLLASVPIAILANVARVFLLCLVAFHWGSAAIEGWVHDLSGYMIFVVAFALLHGVSVALRWRMPARTSGGAAGEGGDA
jgi:exosortase